MTKEAIIKAVKKVAGPNKDAARKFADVIRDIVVEGLTNDGVVKIKGLGTFKVIQVKARKSVDVNTGAEIEIAAHKKVTFTPDNLLADEVNEPLAHLGVIELGIDGGVAEGATEKAAERVAEKKAATEARKMALEAKRAAAEAEKKAAEKAKRNTSAAKKKNKTAAEKSPSENAKSKETLAEIAEKMKIAAEKERQAQAGKKMVKKEPSNAKKNVERGDARPIEMPIEPQDSDEIRENEREGIKKLGTDAMGLKGMLALINGEETQPGVALEKNDSDIEVTGDRNDKEWQPVKLIDVPIPPVYQNESEPVVTKTESFDTPHVEEQLPVVEVNDEESEKIHQQPEEDVKIEEYKPIAETKSTGAYQQIDLGPTPTTGGFKWKIAIIVAVGVLLVLGLVWGFVGRDWMTNNRKDNLISQEAKKSIMTEEEKEEARKAAVAKIKEEAAQMGENDEYVFQGVKMPNSDKNSNIVALAIVKVKEGDRLMSIAKQYYGDKMFWVYIYEANKHKLRGPNDLQIGTELVVPKLNPMLIDVENEESVAKAMKMERQYLGSSN